MEDDAEFVNSLRKRFSKKKEDQLIEPEDNKLKGKIKDVAEVVMGFYDREKGTWTRGEHGVITHVKRYFSNNDGKG